MLWKTALTGFTLSLIIELSQLFNRRITDIDDLMMNTLGALIGWAIFRMMKEHLSELQENGLCPKYQYKKNSIAPS